jgi:hypothetical protein
MPFIFGVLQSHITTSGASILMASNSVAPSTASVTVWLPNPAARSVLLTIILIARLSWTTRIFIDWSFSGVATCCYIDRRVENKWRTAMTRPVCRYPHAVCRAGWVVAVLWVLRLLR